MEVRAIDACELIRSLGKYRCRPETVADKKAYAAAYDVTDFVYKTIKTERTLTINNLRDEIYQNAVAHGLFEEFDKIKDPVRRRRALAMRIMEEAAEMYAAADDPQKFAEEGADVTIITGDVFGYLGMDWHGAVCSKMAFNKERPWKHGKE